MKVVSPQMQSDICGATIEGALRALEGEFPGVRKVYILKYSICDFHTIEDIKKRLSADVNKFIFITHNSSNMYSWELACYSEDTLEGLGIYKSEGA